MTAVPPGRASTPRCDRVEVEFADPARGRERTLLAAQEMVGGLGHLAHQVRGEEDGSSFGGQGAHELADLLHALGVEPVDRLVEDERPGVA